MAHFQKHYHPPGTPPGTLTERMLPNTGEMKISLIDYSSESFVEKQLASAEDCLPYLKESTVTWIHIQGRVTAKILKELALLFELHPLAQEDILNSGQRPKVEAYDTQLFTVLNLPVKTPNTITGEQVSLFLAQGYLISFHQGITDPFETIRKRLHNNPHGKIRRLGADYLLYCLLDLIIDEGFPVLETLGERIELIEEELLTVPNKATLKKLHHIKRELLILRRMLWPQRDLLNKLIRDESEFLNDGTLIYLRDCYDHTIQIIDLLDAYRDMTASMMDVYLSSISYRLNDVMRLLTAISTIFIPLTFLVGLYGMNFNANSDSPWAMPELYWYYGYPMLWGLMITITVGMVAYFKRKDWF
ncbi:MAG: magnesium/cobalt transporter CorA [Spongiibacteraceae bacterium]|jgi:magnesium transporter